MTGSITRILVPTDFSETSDEALAYGKTLATWLGASLHLVHVFEDAFTVGALPPEVYLPLPPELRATAHRNAMQELTARLPEAEQARFAGTTHVVTGPTAKAIVEHAEDLRADLIVMGTHGRTGAAHLFLGSVAERVVRTAGCPVLTVRHRATRQTEHQAIASECAMRTAIA